MAAATALYEQHPSAMAEAIRHVGELERSAESRGGEVARHDDASLERDGVDEAKNGRGLEKLHINVEAPVALSMPWSSKTSAPVGLRQRGTLQVSAWEVSGSRSDMIR